MVPLEDNPTAEGHSTQTARTLIELRQRDDGTWLATQPDVGIDGTGETGALAVMDYCRQIVQTGAE